MGSCQTKCLLWVLALQWSGVALDKDQYPHKKSIAHSIRQHTVFWTFCTLSRLQNIFSKIGLQLFFDQPHEIKRAALKTCLLSIVCWLRTEQWLLLGRLGLLVHVLLPPALPAHPAPAPAGRGPRRSALSRARPHLRGPSPLGVGSTPRPPQGAQQGEIDSTRCCF